jgi:multiple sugar transport system substrate-binding protein
MRRTAKIAISALAAGTMLALAACSPGGASSGDKKVTVMYESTDAFTALNDLFKKIKPEFEKAHQGVTIDLKPVKANDDDYKTKLQLAQRSADTAPDVFYEDTYNVRADAEAGYLLKLDDHLAKWKDWSKFSDAAKSAGAGADGTYAVPLGVDTRVIWYSKPLLQAAGVSLPWQPKSWQDVLDTAAKVKASAGAGVIPFNVYIGQGMGEATTISTVLMLLNGTGDKLYDEASGKWVVGSKGLTDSLQFVKDIYANKYGTTVDQALDANIWQVVLGQDFPKAKIAGTIEGSYLPSFWQKGGSYEWPGYSKDLGVALFPTQAGGGSKYVSMSGGWTLALGAQSKNKDLAFEFLSMALNKENALAYDIQNSQIAVRSDVAAEPSYLSANPFVQAVTESVKYTHFRPATSDYPAISLALQKATEAVVVGGDAAHDAAANYDRAVIAAVGKDHTTKP